MKHKQWIMAMAAAFLLSPLYGNALPQDTSKKEGTRLEDVVVTATKYETPIRNIPGSVTVISAEDLSNQNFPNQDISDALRNIPGITLRRAYAPFPASANIRGAGSDATVYLVNGIPTDWQISQAIPIEMVERVEMLRGPASALYGANAGGGVINIILKEGKGDPSAQVNVGAGTFGRYRTGAGAQGALDKFQYALGAYYEKADGTNIVKNNVNPGIHMIDDCDYDKNGASFTAGYRFTDKARAKVFYNFFNDEYTRGRPHVGGDWDYHFTGLIYDQEVHSNLSLHGSAAYRKDDYLHRYDMGGTNYSPKQKRFMDYDETPLELQGTANMGPHTLTTGFFYNNQTTDQDYKAWSTGAWLYENKFKVQTLAGYLQDAWKITEALNLAAGLRYDHWKNYDNRFSNFITPNPEDRTDHAFSPKAGLRYNFENTASLWANYGMGFKPPTSEQLYDDRTSGGNPRQPNPDLESETTYSWEVGADRWFSQWIQAGLVGFYNYTDDKIMSWFDASNVWINKNIGKSESYGVEAILAFYPTDHWSFNVNYTFNRATIEENPANKALEGNDLPFSPRHKANLGVTYAWPESFSLSTQLRYLGKQYSDDANTVRNAGGKMLMKESFVVDLKGTKHWRVSWGPLEKIHLSLSVDNLFDMEYRTFYMYEDPGTTVFAEVALGF